MVKTAHILSQSKQSNQISLKIKSFCVFFFVCVGGKEGQEGRNLLFVSHSAKR